MGLCRRDASLRAFDNRVSQVESRTSTSTLIFTKMVSVQDLKVDQHHVLAGTIHVDIDFEAFGGVTALLAHISVISSSCLRSSFTVLALEI